MKTTIAPISGGNSYVATSFAVSFHEHSDQDPREVRVHFYDASGKEIPAGAIRPINQPISDALVTRVAQEDAKRAATIPGGPAPVLAKNGPVLQQLANKAAIDSFRAAMMSTPALAGESRKAWTARAGALYVQAVYGVAVAT